MNGERGKCKKYDRERTKMMQVFLSEMEREVNGRTGRERMVLLLGFTEEGVKPPPLLDSPFIDLMFHKSSKEKAQKCKKWNGRKCWV